MVAPGAQRPVPPSGSRCRRLADLAFTFTLAALLCAIAAPPVHAQNSTDEWAAAGGTVEVSTTTLRIREGETASYRVRLTRRLPAGVPQGDSWWVMLHVDGQRRSEGEYDSNGDGDAEISWTPSVGREFEPSDWPTEDPPQEETDSYWRDFRFHALEDDDEQDSTIVLSHEVWDHDAYCPDALHPDNLPRVTLHIIDDDGPNAPKPELSIGDATVGEGGTARFEVRLDTDSERDVTVRYRTSNGTAQSGSDYEAVDDTLTIEAGSTIADIEVPTTQDSIYEGDETFTVRLSSPDRATLGDAAGEGTITDDDPLPRLSIGNATVEEGDTAEFEVTLSGERSVTATVRYSTMDGTAFQGSDYTAIDGGTLTFRPGDDSETIRVRTREDSAREDAETFTVVLSEPQEATITTGTGTGTINDDDAAALPSLRIADATVTEGDAASFTVTLSATSTDTVTVAWETRNGTALAGSDYTTDSDTLTFNPSDLSQTITVATIPDTDYEGDETFTVRLSSPSMATIDRGTATGTIEDDDDPGISINDVTVREGSPAQFTVRLEGPTDHQVTVTATTSDGTAEAGDDYTHKSETLTIPARETAATFSVDTLADEETDSNETFTVTLSNPGGATLLDDMGTGTITEGGGNGGGNGGTTRRLSIDDVSVEEGAAAQFTVTLTRTSNQPVTVEVETGDGTAEAGTDYTAKSETLTIPAGETTASFSVDTIDDQDPEEDESFTVTLSNPSGATLLDGTGTGTIAANDGGGTTPQLSIADAAAVTEGETAQFTVTLTGIVDQEVTVGFRTGDGSATAGDDYTTESGTLTFTASDTTRTISVTTLDDTIREESETFSVTLSDPAGATIAVGTATGTINDNDDTALPALSIADADPVTEGGTAQFEVTLSAASGQVVTVAYATADGTAVADADYTAAAAALTFQPGDRTKTIPVSTLDDTDQEPQEQFTVVLRDPGGATVSRDTGTGTIDDNDAPGTLPQLSIGDASAAEGDTVQFTVTLTGNSDQDVTVDFRTGDGTARAGADYDAISDSLTFGAGDTTRTISVTTLDDTIRETDETFSVTLTNPAGATLADDTATGTIEDDDDTALPALSIADADPVTEGGTAQFEVTLSAASGQVVTVAYATADGTAVADADYTAAAATLTFQPGDRTKTIPVSTLDDSEQESQEQFTVTLSGPGGATLDRGTGTGTIDDNDAPGTLPQLSVGDASAAEGDAVQFTVTLTGNAGQNVTVGFRTGDGTARAGSDYDQSSGTLTFPAGATTQTISVATLEDTIREEDESFSVTLSDPAGATIVDGTATGTINDNDDTALPALSIADADPVTEGGTAQFEVTLSAASGQIVTVSYATADGTAVADSDYTPATGTLSFQPGDRTRTISVSTVDDDDPESEEHFTVTLSGPDGATLDDGSGQGTINDDDEGDTTPELPELSIGDASAEEGGTVVFEVVLSAAGSETVTVDFETRDDTALAGSDYEQASGTLTFPAGTDTQSISVETLEDDVAEADERFTISLSNPDGATIADGTARGTIRDDDGGGGSQPVLTIDDAPPVAEGGTALFTVTLSQPSGRAVTVAHATADGTARAGLDYTSTSGTLRFEPGDTSRTIRVPVLDDRTREDAETFTVELREPDGATLADPTGTGTITDDDDDMLPALSIGDAAAVAEGVTARFPVTLSAATDEAVTVAFATADGTADDASDYTAAAGTLTFDPGTTRLTIEVVTLEDGAEEPEEGFTVALSDPVGATLEDDTGAGTITDNDGGSGRLPEISIADAAAAEGGTAAFAVTLRPPAGQAVTVRYRTVEGTALEGSDYTAASGMLRFEPGEETRLIRVSVLDDEILEDLETFSVELSDPAGAVLGDRVGTGTITDDDEGRLPGLTIGDAAPVTEGVTARFPVTLSAASEQEVTVAFATVDVTAAAGSDYNAHEGTLTFTPGSTLRTIQVATRQDEIVESDEAFAVTLSTPVGATLEDAHGAGTIIDDDFVEGLPALAVADAEPVGEGVAAEFVVTLTPSSEQEVTVSYRTVDDTAAAGFDYAATEGTLRFEPGQTVHAVAVATLIDDVAEDAERFTLEISEPVRATIADGLGTGTITDTAERIGTVSRTILPELGRALAFTAVACRFDGSLAGSLARGGSQDRTGRLSLSHAITADRRTSPLHEPLTLERALGDSSFLMPSSGEGGGPGRLAAWGCGDYRNLAGGGDGGVNWNGEVFSVHLGADVRLSSDVVAGLSVSRSRAFFDYAGGGSGAGGGGTYDLRLMGLHPYLGWSVSPDLDVWTTVGHAWGELRIDDELTGRLLTSPATLDSALVGASGRLLARGKTTLKLKAEGALARLGIASDGSLVEALAVDMRRLRLSTEASREQVFSSGASLTPWGELGLRHDGGDGETGAGLEAGGGLRYRNPEAGWIAEGYGRWLAAHEGALREWGVGAQIRFDPGASGRGPSVTLTPGWGDTASGLHRLWERGAAGPALAGAPGSRLDAQFGYGFAAFRGQGLLTPFGMVSLDRRYGRGYRLGSRLALGRSANLSLEAERRERAAATAVHAIFLRGAVQF